ncbi:MAG: PRC-barrel domain-containing protein [Solirubrobacterales bacterium]
MADLGNPSSSLVLEPRTPVYSCDGEQVGRVARVLNEPDADIFEGIEVDPGGLTGERRFIAADQIEEVFERGVLLKLDRAAAESAPQR